ncbi:MAG: efflux RND transporter permease subunit [Porticoccaceae bacterium]|nr:efflux RND transporter permease subunit [Porticoccaceae bacterium]
MKLFERFLDNHVLANILFVLILVLGTLAFQQMPRARDPDINFNWINIMTALPGASAIDVEKRITDPIEDVISSSVRDIKFVSSTSREGISTILLRFDQLNEREFDKRIADLRREVQNVYTDKLPEEAQDPQIYEISTSSGFPTAIVVLTSPSFDDDLRRYGAVLRKEFEQLPGIDKALMQGAEDPELHIAFHPEKLDGLGITPADIADTVRAYFKDTAIGDLETGNGKWTVRLQGTTGSLSDLEAMPLVSAKGVVALGSVASIYRAAAEPEILARYQGQPAILYSLTKQEGVNTLDLIDKLRAYLDTENQAIGSLGYNLVLVDDQTVSTREAISLMQNNALIGLALVVLVSWLFLGTRIAFLTSIGIPFTLAGTFFILHATNLTTLNNSVLLGVVIALGMLVDDAVVVVEAIYYRLQRGAKPMQASLDSLREVAAPVATSVMTTIAVFLPLMLLPGILGEFMKIVPMVVCLALAVSLLEAFWMLPAHVTLINVNFRRESRTQRLRRRFTSKVRHHFSLTLLKALRRPWLSLLGVAAIFAVALGLLLSGALKVNFFASDPFRVFYVNVEMPAGTPLTQTLKMAEEFEQKTLALLEDDEIRATTAYAGQMFTQTEPLYGDNVGQVMVSLAPQLDGRRDVRTIVDTITTSLGSRYKAARISVLLLEDGPPIGQPINIKVRGDDFDAIEKAVNRYVDYMEQQGYYRNINLDFRSGNPEVVVRLNGDAIKRAGLAPDTVTRALQAFVDGELVTSYQDRGEEVDVRVVAHRSEAVANTQISALFNETLYNADGDAVPLADLVDTSYEYGQQNIRHYNYLRTITVSADFDENATNTVDANAELAAFWQTVAAEYPTINIDFSGELDDINESIDAIVMLFLVGLGLIYLILGTQFRSYWQPLLVLVSIPLAFTGVILGLYITGNPLSLYTLYGVVALSGISVNTSIVLVSAANDRLEAGMSVLHATVYAARRRVIPILITSLTTIAGLFSLAAGFAGKSLVWGPIATAIVSGLFFSTILTLLVIPLLYRAIQDSTYIKRLRVRP